MVQIPFFRCDHPYGEIHITKFCPGMCGGIEGRRCVGLRLIDLSVTYYDGIIVDAETYTGPSSMTLDRQPYCDPSWQLRQVVRHRRPGHICV